MAKEDQREFRTNESSLFPFEPTVVVFDVLKRWLVVLVMALVIGVGAYILTDMSYTPTYQTSATLVVTTRGNSTTVYNNLASTTSMAAVFDEVINSSVFRRIIQEEAGISNFSGQIKAGAVADTNLLIVTVSDTNPRTAFLMIRAILENHQSLTEQIVGEVVLEVLQAPSVPSYPSNSVDPVDMMKKAMLLSAAAACAVLAWISFNRDVVRSDSEARNKLDCQYLGQVPHERKYKTLFSFLRHRKTSVLISNPLTSFRFVETVGKLRRRIERRMGENKVLMITSLLENEGKSTVAVNLAMAMARKNRKVLLIDCDLHKPACAILLEHKWNGFGVRDVLNGQAEPGEAISLEGSSGLYLMLEKKGGRDSGDLVASANMKHLLNWARREFDAVILDLPPISAVTDAEAMADLADCSLLVVRQNAALAPALNKAIGALERGKAKLLGCVLNNVYETVLFSGQGQGGHGYGYGKYGKYGHYGHYGRYGAYDADQSGK